MAIQFSVFVLASLLFAAHALTGLRKRGGSQGVAFQSQPLGAPGSQVAAAHPGTPQDELGCPSLRFPSSVRCRILLGPCKNQLSKCDLFYAKSPLPSYTSTIAAGDRRRRVKPDEKCEMATCLAQTGPDWTTGPLVVSPGTLPTRTTNSTIQPNYTNKQYDENAVLCTQDFMKSRNSEVDKALMRCVQMRARPVARRPRFETTTTSPGPGPANWYCVPSINFDRRSGNDITKKVTGPFLNVTAAKAQLDTTFGESLMEQFICEMRVANKYNNVLQATPVLQLANVTQTPEILGPLAVRDELGFYVKPAAGWAGVSTPQTWEAGFNIGCKDPATFARVTVDNCPNKAEMLKMCQDDRKCNPSAWR